MRGVWGGGVGGGEGEGRQLHSWTVRVYTFLKVMGNVTLIGVVSAMARKKGIQMNIRTFKRRGLEGAKVRHNQFVESWARGAQ